MEDLKSLIPVWENQVAIFRGMRDIDSFPERADMLEDNLRRAKEEIGTVKDHRAMNIAGLQRRRRKTRTGLRHSKRRSRSRRRRHIER